MNTDDKPTHADLPIVCRLCALALAETAAKVVTKDIISYCVHNLTFVIARARFGMIAAWDLEAPVPPEMYPALRDAILAAGREIGKGAGDVVSMIRKH